MKNTKNSIKVETLIKELGALLNDDSFHEKRISPSALRKLAVFFVDNNSKNLKHRGEKDEAST